MFSVENKTAFITGGSSGIGQAVAHRLALLGCSVIIADINKPSKLEPKTHFVHCDVSQEDAIKTALYDAKSLLNQPIDIVILNAGVGDVGPKITDTDAKLVNKISAINQWGVFYGLKHAPEHMNDGGSIIVTSSMASLISIPGTAVYSACKAAINSMVSMAALELGKRQIRVNAVCPGYVDTELGNSAEELKLTKMFTALGRHADPATDIAGVYIFLASSASQYMTGQALEVDGGWRCGPTDQLLELVTGSSLAPGSR
ncbi:MAG: SDR family oxidoreductase [Halieaceae bacterium]|nr:SDR family oxidoreductase [Halieaceae bacterium]